MPTYWGEKVVCRVLDNHKASLPLEAIGFETAQRATFERIIRAPYGLVLVTGPTGSGKSTTLYAALNAVRSPDVKRGKAFQNRCAQAMSSWGEILSALNESERDDDRRLTNE